MSVFEGDEITSFIAKIPTISVECEQAYPRGTEMTLNVEVVVKAVGFKSDGRGGAIRLHDLQIEALTVKEVTYPFVYEPKDADGEEQQTTV